METRKESLIVTLVDLEKEMFSLVRSSVEAPCQKDLDAFALHRDAQLFAWSVETLESYQADLLDAKQSGINLMTIKYARMGGQIPSYSCNPLIPTLVDRFLFWQIEIKNMFPKVMRQSRTPDDFCTYLGCELETYSDRTIKLLASDVASFTKKGKNMTVVTYERLARSSGFSSLMALELHISL
ncbi:MAG: DUF4125 family protein [Sphaerochaeta sp.]|nr:DUF4125 family protein [Sphaerochaeta sp.]